MKFKIGDKARAIVSDPRVANTIVTITDAEKVMDIQYYIAQDTNGEKWGFSEDELEPADSKTLRMADGTIIGEFNTIEVLPQKDDTVRGENHFCTGFRYGKIPTPEKPVTIEETAEYFRQQLISNCGVPPMFFFKQIIWQAGGIRCSC